ncbi:hypothetical protein F5Y16DRAFT_355166 [Xylariaceae sp. FL0255]|nr:hypothetical protein F5Y16DRAFT_355166 [Xylariaceae sp. FL0255]
MPPRKRLDLESEGSSSDVGNLPKTTAATSSVIPRALKNIEKIKRDRARTRAHIKTDFETWFAQRQSQIERRLNIEMEKRKSETKDLLQRYIVAVERRAVLEKAIAQVRQESQLEQVDSSSIFQLLHSGGRDTAAKANGAFDLLLPASDVFHTVSPPTPKAQDENSARAANGLVKGSHWEAGLHLGYQADGQRRKGLNTRDDTVRSDPILDREPTSKSGNGQGTGFLDRFSW